MYLLRDAEDMSTMLEHTTATWISKLISPFVNVTQFGLCRVFRQSTLCLFTFQPGISQPLRVRSGTRDFLDSIAVEVGRSELQNQFQSPSKSPVSHRNPVTL